jgi:nucleotide-binding universal stress UspA family protein
MIPQIRKILYATDLSKNSSYAFLYAVDMAKRHDAKVVILHVVEAVPLYAYSELGFLSDKVVKRTLEKDRLEDINLIKNYLPEFCRKVESEIGPPCVELVSKILVPIGHPADEILKVAAEEGCDVIVLGTHGKGFLAHTFLGSVSNAVLHRTRKPVFIIPLPSDKIAMDWDGI